MTDYTRDYKKAKTGPDKKKVTDRIEEDPMFARTKDLIRYEELLQQQKEGAKDRNPLGRANTIHRGQAKVSARNTIQRAETNLSEKD